MSVDETFSLEAPHVYSSYSLIRDLCKVALLLEAGSVTKAEDAAKAVLKEIREEIEFRESCEGQEILRKAREKYVDSECNIDVEGNTLIHHNGTDGYWILGWLFLKDEEIEEEEDDGD